MSVKELSGLLAVTCATERLIYDDGLTALTTGG